MSSFLPFEWFDTYTDTYRLPDGQLISGVIYRGIQQQQMARLRVIRDETKHDPYNHVGRYVEV